MQKLTSLALGLTLVAGLIAGCGKTGPSQPQSQSATPTAEDISMVSAAIASNPALVEEDVYEGTDRSQLDPAGAGLAAIRPLFWWRSIRSVTRTFETEYTNPDTSGRPTMATVTVHKHLVGTFNIVAGDSTNYPDSLLRKPLEDDWVRHLLLKRVCVRDTGDTVTYRWKLVGSSGVEITSKDAVTHIQSIRVQAGVLDTTITDPLQMHRLRRVLLLPAGTEVVVTVTTGATDDVVLLYRWHHRMRFHNNGDGTYTFRWITGDAYDQDYDAAVASVSHDGDRSWVRNFGVNALSHGTLFDDAAAYDSHTWVFPFAVQRERCWLDD